MGVARSISIGRPNWVTDLRYRLLTVFTAIPPMAAIGEKVLPVFSVIWCDLIE